VTAQETINLGLQHHQAGRLAEAEQAYRQALAINPRSADAMNLLGAVAGQVGRLDAALDLMRRASALEPNRAEFHANMGMVLSAQKQTVPAAQSFIRALQIDPNKGDYYFRLGGLHMELGNFDQALACYEMTACIDNGGPLAHNSMGIAHRYKGNLDAAIAWYGQAIALKPDYFEAANNLAESFYQKGEFQRAIDSCRYAIKFKPDYPEALNNLGNALRRIGRPREAVEAYQKAIDINPNLAQTQDNMGNAFQAMGEFARAEALYRRAAELAPGYASPRWNLSLIRLRQGEYESGWELYDWRLKMPGMSLRPDLPGIPWEGSELDGKRILLVAEQGLGDTIQFIRYAAMVAQRGGRVTLACPKELHALLRHAEGVSNVVAGDGPLPAADFHCALLSLPKIFRTNRDAIPAKKSYLSADPALKEKWSQRMQAGPDALRIGLAWAGNSNHRENHLRSFDLWTLAPLVGARDNAKFYSLQVAESAFQAIAPPKGMDLTDLGKEIADFSDTAAIIANLDLVITADTAVAHLAGALGKPVWVLLPFIADWRWLTDRSDSPWYPTMKLFRQTNAGDWEAPLRKIAEALLAF
jgi:tetratricopeptide (TPR) repeat protein